MEWDFSQAVDDIAKVPEDFRGLYIKDEKDGKVKLASDKPEVKSAVPAIIGLNTALKAARAETKAAKDKAKGADLAPLGEYGDTPEKIAEGIKARIAELQAGKPNVEKLKQEFAQAHAAEIQKRDARVTALTGQLHSILVVGEATKAIAAEKGIPELLLPFIQGQVKVFEENGTIEVRVVDSAGDPRYSGVTGKPMAMLELVKEMKTQEKYGRLFDSEAPAGGGSKPPSPGARSTVLPAGSKLSPQQKIAEGLRQGQYSGRP